MSLRRLYCIILSCCRRLAVVELFSLEIFHSETIVGMLKSCEDLERIIQKVSFVLHLCYRYMH